MMKLYFACAVALNLRAPAHTLVSNTKASSKVAADAENPGAGMDASLGFEKIYKDGYMHVGCMMDKMEHTADYHDALKREHDYKNAENVSIVRYTDRVDVEKTRKMTPKVCFDFCRTVPDMGYFGLINGRECYCTPYYHKMTGDGVCDAGCEGDMSITCGNTNGMSDVYSMHACADTVDTAKTDMTKIGDLQTLIGEVHTNATLVLDGLDAAIETIDVKEDRVPVLTASTELSKLARDVEAALSKTKDASDTLSATVDSVTSSTTTASEVTQIEDEQKAMIEASETLEASGKKLKEYVEDLKMDSIWTAAGLDKTTLIDLGHSLDKVFTINPWNPKIEKDVKTALSCDDNGVCANDVVFSVDYPRDSQIEDMYLTGAEKVPSDMTFQDYTAHVEVLCGGKCMNNKDCNMIRAHTLLKEKDSFGTFSCYFYNLPANWRPKSGKVVVSAPGEYRNEWNYFMKQEFVETAEGIKYELKTP
jgi:hypothetical protein